MRRILVLRGGALGDFIVTLPALLALRHKWPDAEIELVGNATAAELARRRGVIDRVYSQHEARWRELYGGFSTLNSRFSIAEPDRGLAKTVFQNTDATAAHTSVDLAPQSKIENQKSKILPWLSTFDLVVNYWPDPEGTLARAFPVRAGQRFISAPAMPSVGPAAAHYAGALGELGVVAESYFCQIGPESISFPGVTRLDGGRGLPTPPIPKTAEANPNRRGRETPPSIKPSAPIAIHPGSGSLTKNWPIERWREVIARLSAPVRVILGEAELERWSPISPSGFGANVRLLSNLPLEQLVAELRTCCLFLGHDSGISHLAAACGVPSILLFGPTDPAIWAPPAPHVTVLRRGNDLATIGVDEMLEAARRAPRTR